MKAPRGFTLIEVMITVAIVGILAAVALPSYRDHVVRSQLVEAHSLLAAQRVKMEQFYQDNRTYVGACATGTVASLPGNNGAIDNANTKYFAFDCPTLTATAYTVRATGAGSTAGFVFTIDQSNVRNTTAVASGWTLPASACWITKKGGVC